MDLIKNRKTRNVTIAVSREACQRARLDVVELDMTLSAAVKFLAENLPRISQAIRNTPTRNRTSALDLGIAGNMIFDCGLKNQIKLNKTNCLIWIRFQRTRH